jgi:hypothetical protein
MEINRILDDYRNHTILSTKHKGTFRGRVWKKNKLIHETESSSIENTIRILKKFIDSKIENE